MRILLVTQYFPPEPTRVGDLAVGLRELGHDVTVLTGFPSYPYDRIYPGYRLRPLLRESYFGVRVIRVPAVAKYGPSRLNRLLTYLSFAVSASTLGPVFVPRPDRIIVFQVSPITMAIPALAIKAVRGGRLALWVQDLWPETLEALNIVTNRTLLQFAGALVRFIYRQCDRVLVQSPGISDAVAARGVPRSRIIYLPNWAEDLYGVLPVDPQFIRSEGLDGEFNLMFAGNIGLAQNVGLILQVAEMLRDHQQIRFVIVGDGAELSVLMDRARRLHLNNVVFKGRQPLERMPQYFAAADALLVQLKMNPVFAATIPSKVQSYLACGRPILAALDGSGAEVIREARAGIVCRPDDAEAMREAVVTLWRMPREERERMGANGRTYYDAHFDRRLVLSRLERILDGM